MDDREIAEKLGRDEHDSSAPPWLLREPFSKAMGLVGAISADLFQPGGRERVLELLDTTKREHDRAEALREIAAASDLPFETDPDESPSRIVSVIEHRGRLFVASESALFEYVNGALWRVPFANEVPAMEGTNP